MLCVYDTTHLCYIFLQAFVLPDDLPVLELLLGCVALVILFFPGVVSVLPDEQHLGHHDQCHRQETAKQVGQRHERERRVLLVT